MGGHNVGINSGCNGHCHDIPDRDLGYLPSVARRPKWAIRARRTSSLVRSAKNCQWFHQVWHNGPSAIQWTTPSTFQGTSELQGDTLASSFSKAAFIFFHAVLQHKVSKCTFWAWHLCLQEREDSTPIYTGVHVVKHVSRKLNMQKGKCPLCTLLGAGSHINICTMGGEKARSDRSIRCRSKWEASGTNFL